MAVYQSDTFTDTDGVLLSAHGGWTKDATTGDLKILSNKVTPSATTGTVGVYTANTAPESNSCTVRADITAASGVRGFVYGQCTGREADFCRFYTNLLTNFTIQVVIANVLTSSGVWGTPVNGTTYGLKLELVGGVSQKGYVDGVLRISLADSQLTAVGKGGIWISAVVDTGQIDNFSLETVSIGTEDVPDFMVTYDTDGLTMISSEDLITSWDTDGLTGISSDDLIISWVEEFIGSVAGPFREEIAVGSVHTRDITVVSKHTREIEFLSSLK